jgi:hypothetical protein
MAGRPWPGDKARPMLDRVCAQRGGAQERVGAMLALAPESVGG